MGKQYETNLVNYPLDDCQKIINSVVNKWGFSDERLSDAYFCYVKCLHGYRPGRCTFKTYLYRSLTNTFIKGLGNSQPCQLAADPIDPHRDNGDDGLVCAELLACLSEEERDLIALWQTGYTHAEIGRRYGFSRTWAQCRVARILEKIREAQK